MASVTLPSGLRLGFRGVGDRDGQPVLLVPGRAGARAGWLLKDLSDDLIHLVDSYVSHRFAVLGFSLGAGRPSCSTGIVLTGSPTW